MSSNKWTTANMPDQTGRVTIVTGANSGIGFEAAKALALKGARVIVAARSLDKGNSAVAEIMNEEPAGSAEFMQLDLADLESVRVFVDDFRSKFDRLDILVNNAGVMMPPEREETEDGFELQIGTNHLGHFALTIPLLDLLAITPNSRVVTVSSNAQHYGQLDVSDLQWVRRDYDRTASYGASKIANMLFTLQLQKLLDEADSSTKAVACHPGWTATNLQRSTPLFRLLNPLFAMKPWQGALPTLYAATSPNVESGGYYGPDGFMNMRGYPAPNKPAKESTDPEAAADLWRLSEDLTRMTLDDTRGRALAL